MRGAISLWRIGVFACLLAGAGLARADEAAHRVLILFPSESTIPAASEIARGLRSVLQSEATSGSRTFEEYLDGARFPNAEQQTAFARYLQEKYADSKLDLAIAIGAPALSFLDERREEIFPSVPIIYAGTSEVASLSKSTADRTIRVLTDLNSAKTAELALGIRPSTRNLAVITGTSALDRHWEAEARRQLAPLQNRVALTFLAGLPLDEVLRRVAQLPPDTAIIYLSMFRDGSGQNLIPRKVAESMAAVANAPIYGVYDSVIDHGIVGGYVIALEPFGRETGQVALRLLQGQKLPENYSADVYRYIVDWRKLQAWGLDASKLPPGTDIRFRELSAWEQYRTPLLFTVAALLLQALLIFKFSAAVRNRRIAQNAARESEDRMNAAIAGADLGLWSIGRESLSIWATKRCRNLLGLDERQALSVDDFLTCLSPVDQTRARDRISKVFTTGEMCVAEYALRADSGPIRWVLSKAIPKKEPDGSVSRLIGVILDITERKQRDAEVEGQRAELAHLTRVSILGALSGALAHELNQPLTAILSNAQAAKKMLSRGTIEAAEIQRILDDIMTDDKRAGDVIHHLRSLLRKDEPTKDRIDANTLVAGVLDLCHSDLVLKGITVMKRTAVDLSPVLADPVQLRQVLLNLILNACDSMSNKPARERLLVVETKPGEHGGVHFAVIDSGEGIASAKIDDLSQPFFTTKTFGLGLGLPICHWIITAHGGNMFALNNPGGGAIFGFELPSASEVGRELQSSRVSG